MLDHSTLRVPLLDLDLLRTLVSIADTGNFSSAAEEVGRTPSAVSMQVKRVEDLIGRAVFIRDSRSVRLTADGEVLVEHGRRVLALNREVMARFIDPGLVGEVRLGTPDDVAERYLTGMLRQFADTFPGITLTVSVDTTDRMLDKIAEGRLDLALVTCEAGFRGDDAAELIHREPLVWAMLRGGSAIERTPLPVSVWEDGCVWRDVAMAGLKDQGRECRVVFESAHISGQRACLLSDMAVTTMPVSALGGRVVAVDRRHRLPPLPDYALGMVSAPGNAPLVEAAKDHLRAGFQKLAQAPGG